MQQKTSIIEMNGTKYLRLPPIFFDNCQFEVGEDKAVIEFKDKRFGPFLQAWAVKLDKARKKGEEYGRE